MPESKPQDKAKVIPLNDFTLDSRSALPLYQQIKDLIKRQIANNVWRLGEMIPSENELAAGLQVSAGTVKKALADLVNEGVLVRRQGKGTFVARPDFKRSFIRFFRYGLGSGPGALPASRVLSCRVIDPPAGVRGVLNLTRGERVIAIKRLRLLEDEPLMLEDLFLPRAIFDGFEKKDISRELLYPIYDAEYDTPIVWAEEFLEPRIAEGEAARYLGLKPGAPVIFIERIAYTLGDKPVEFRSSLGRGDRFRYHIELR